MLSRQLTVLSRPEVVQGHLLLLAAQFLRCELSFGGRSLQVTVLPPDKQGRFRLVALEGSAGVLMGARTGTGLRFRYQVDDEEHCFFTRVVGRDGGAVVAARPSAIHRVPRPMATPVPEQKNLLTCSLVGGGRPHVCLVHDISRASIELGFEPGKTWIHKGMVLRLEVGFATVPLFRSQAMVRQVWKDPAARVVGRAVAEWETLCARDNWMLERAVSAMHASAA